jgi:cysteine synthase B
MSILSCIGNTPITLITKLNKNPKVKLFAKLEGNNPGGSVKDRPALYMILDAEKKGLLNHNKTVLEPTSGNTGIGLAMVCVAKNYKIKLVMPACVSIERKLILEALGAEVILSPANEGTDGAIRLAHKILNENPETYFMPNQFENPANILAHYETTAQEIIVQTQGEITHFVAGMGTTGTLMGVSKRLKEFNKRIKIVGVEPVKGHRIQGLKNMEEAIVPKIYNPSYIDEHYYVTDDEAFEITRRLALEEGIFAGMSSGAAMAIALKVAHKIEKGVIIVILPDRGDRYLSTSLFTSVCGKCPP